jgi:XTP/dITP diphosphohydrolase
MKLVFATNNKHKLQEVRDIVGDRVEVLSLADINCYDDIPETADTLQGNALIKARHIYAKYGLDCFADDTGLEVEALGGAPGVYSARYAGDECNSEANMQKLLQNLTGETNRNAQFRTVIALIIRGEEKLFNGIVKGTIATEKKGDSGFGYDPIFIPEGHSESFAQMSSEMKNSMSHRFRATQQLGDYLKENYD